MASSKKDETYAQSKHFRDYAFLPIHYPDTRLNFALGIHIWLCAPMAQWVERWLGDERSQVQNPPEPFFRFLKFVLHRYVMFWRQDSKNLKIYFYFQRITNFQRIQKNFKLKASAVLARRDELERWMRSIGETWALKRHTWTTASRGFIRFTKGVQHFNKLLLWLLCAVYCIIRQTGEHDYFDQL